MKIMIVEDEENILERLGTLVRWEQEGFEQPFLFSGAVDALAFLEHNTVDVILTDIFMPVINGLEFIKMIREQNRICDIIILTGHNEFEFAQEAMELGVKRYLLKPISEEQLKKVLTAVKKDITERMKLWDWLAIARERLSEVLPVVKNQFFNDLLDGRIQEPHEIKARAEGAEIPLTAGPVSCIAVRIIHESSVRTLAEEVALRQIIQEILADKAIYVMAYDGTELIILKGKVRQDHIEIIRESIYQNLKLRIGIGISTIGSDLSEAARLAKEAVEAAKSIRGEQGDYYLHHMELRKNEKGSIVYPYPLERQILDVLRLGEVPRDDVMKAFLQAVMPPRQTVEEARIMMIQLLAAIQRFAADAGVVVNDYFNKACREIQTFGEVEQAFLNMIRAVVSERTRQDIRYTEWMVAQVKECIGRDFGNHELTVTSLAESMNVTPNYLSRVFSNITGMTCIEYLTKVRMEAAGKLLAATDRKSYLIAGETGYNNPNYFSALFKKHTGLSPKEYRERMQGEQKIQVD